MTTEGSTCPKCGSDNAWLVHDPQGRDLFEYVGCGHVYPALKQSGKGHRRKSGRASGSRSGRRGRC